MRSKCLTRRLNVEIQDKLYDEFWSYAALEGFSSISEATRMLMVEYVRKRKKAEGVIPLNERMDDDRQTG